MGIIMKDGHQYGIGGIERAEDVSYDNTESGMTATDVQGALDELNAGLTPTVTETSAGITYTVYGKSMRKMDFAWATWGDVKSFYNALPSADKVHSGNVVNTVFEAQNNFTSPALGYIGIDYQQGIYAEYISGSSVATMQDTHRMRGFLMWFI